MTETQTTQTEQPARKGRGRKQGNSRFVANVNSGDVPRLTPQQQKAAQDFYSASRTIEIQFLQIAREYGCCR